MYNISFQQQIMQFNDVQPCKHCGGESLEQWRLFDNNFATYKCIVFMCNRCTFETVAGHSDRERGIDNWNAGVIQQLCQSGMKQIGMLSFTENWQFHTQYLNAEYPRRRTQCQ